MASSSKNTQRKTTSPGLKPVGSSGKSKKTIKGSSPAETKNFLQSIDNWIAPRLNLVFLFCLFLTIFFGIMLFDVKISTGGDDSSYIEMANHFLPGMVRCILFSLVFRCCFSV